jgi:rfaE bifunctional protein nucleotidyltransferase chain/domain
MRGHPCRALKRRGFVTPARDVPGFFLRPFRARLGSRLRYTGNEVVGLFSRDEILQQRRRWKDEGKTVVFTNGCYDLLHPGHVRLLEQARSLGDVLILALNSDASVRRAKGDTRPILPEGERAELAGALEAIDAVTLFDEDTPRELIAEVLPDVLVKGADWSHFVAGREEVEAAGGRVVTLPLEPGYSTTNLVGILASQP